MNNREVEKKIKKAYSHITAPDIIDSILSDCETQKGNVVMMEKKNRTPLFKGLALAAMALIIVVGIFGFNYYEMNYKAVSTIAFDVNPSIELKVNSQDRILEVIPLNDDAITVIGDMDLKGSDLDVAVNALIGSMIRNGYLSDLANSMLISVENNDPEKAAQLQQLLSDEISQLITTNNFDGAVLSQSISENDQTLRNLASEYGITMGKAQLIQQILSMNPLYTFENLSKLTINELNLLAPFGCDNPRPVFKITGIQNPQLKVMGDQGQHFRINFQTGHGSLAGVKFNASPAEIHQLQAESLNGIAIAGELTVNRWQGRTTPQIQICDLKDETGNEVNGSKLRVIDQRFINSSNKFNSEFVYGFFNVKLLKQVAAQVAPNIKLISLNDQAPIIGDTLVIVDCPPSIAAFESLIDRLQVKQIVLKCYTQHNIASKPLPSRQDFGKLYRFTSTHHDVDLRKDLEKLADYLNFDKESLVFMIQVFSEAKFVKIKNGLLTGTPSNQRIELTKTKRYQARVAQIQAQQLFLNSKTADLLKRLNLTI